MKEIWNFFYTYYGVYVFFFISLLSTSISFYLINRKEKISDLVYFCIITLCLNYYNSLVLYNMEDLSFVYRLCCIGIIGGFAPFVVFLGIRLWKKVLASSFYDKNKYGICIFICSLLYFLFSRPEKVRNWVASWYGVNYSMGIGSRFFIGSLLDWIKGGAVIFSDDVILFYSISFGVLIALVSFLFNCLIVNSDIKYRKAIFFSIFIYLISPGSFYAYIVEAGRLEMYTYIFMLIAVICHNSIKNNVVKYGVITLLSCISVATYQGFVFLYYPMLMIVMFTDIFLDKGKDKAKIYGSLACFVFTCLAFIFFQFFSYVNFDNANEFCNHLSRKAIYFYEKQAVDLEIFGGIVRSFDEINKKFLLNEHPRELLWLSFVLLLPFWFFIASFYVNAWGSVKKIKWYKNIYVYYILINICILPQFLLNIDWGRWMLALINMLFFEIFYLIYIKDKGMLLAVKKLNTSINNNMFIYLLFILYLSKFSYYCEESIFFDMKKLLAIFNS